jgi:hypothetical protein
MIKSMNHEGHEGMWEASSFTLNIKQAMRVAL